MPSGSASTAIAYLDSSALVKLVIEEPESAALRRELRDWPRRASSELAVVELLRATSRHGSRAERLARSVLAAVALCPLDRRTLMRATQLGPPTLGSLDAIHLASALELAPHIAAFFTYDRRLQRATRQAGLTLSAPGVA